jgi:hypothetical protein
MRLASQCDEQINGYSSVVEGLRKRPGTEYLAKLGNLTGDNFFTHTINRDINEQYIVVIENGTISVFDFEGNQKTVNMPPGSTYLNSVSPKEDFRCVTVADYTFILNTKIPVKQGTALAPSRAPEAIIWIKQGSYGAKYSVYLDGAQKASYTVPDGSATSHANSVTTDNIATQLYDQLVANVGETFTIQRYGSTLWVKRKDSGNFTLRVDDSIGDNGVLAIKDRTQNFNNLPTRAVNGFTVELTGDSASTFDNYYVKFLSDGGNGNDGVWEETVKGGEAIGLDPSTMPHALVREADGSFTFRTIDWSTREVGDLDSNPLPSFVGRAINDMFFHRNRLGFVADENIVMSKAGDYFNLFRGTATQLLDNDPIDVGVSHVKVSILRHAIPFNETLLLFSDQTQFQLGETQLLTPETISVNQTTEYECSLRAKPVGVGNNVYFAVNRGNYTGIREYYVDESIESEKAHEVTVHVPKYLKGGVFKLAASSNEDVLLALSDQAPNEIYVYKFYFSEEDKLQASWSRWVFPEDVQVLNCDFIESRLYLILKRPDGIHLEAMNLEPGAVDAGWDIHVHLDSKLTHTDVAVSERTDIPSQSGEPVYQIDLPFKLGINEPIHLVCAAGGPFSEGQLFTEFDVIDQGTYTSLRLEADIGNQPFVIGRPYSFRYVMSPFTLREDSLGGGQKTVSDGRLQVRRASVLYNRTGYFRIEVTPDGRGTYQYTYSGRTLGVLGNVIGKISTEEGRFDFPVQSKNDRVRIELVNDSFLPSYVLSLEWEGFYHTLSRRY